jgi:hypothetical protein
MLHANSRELKCYNYFPIFLTILLRYIWKEQKKETMTLSQHVEGTNGISLSIMASTKSMSLLPNSVTIGHVVMRYDHQVRWERK